MKLKVITLALLLAGVGSSYALAGGGHGNGKGTKAKEHAAGTAPGDESTSRESTTADASKKKVVLCHKAGKSGRVVQISVSSNAVKAHSRHGDSAPAADGTCAAPKHTGTTSTGTTSTGTTSTGTTTTVHTTTAASGH